MNEDKIERLLGLLENLGIDDVDSSTDVTVNLDPQPVPNFKQTDMPKDWLIQLSDAKIQHDKHGNVSCIFVLPLSWRHSFNDKIKNGNDDMYQTYYDKKHNLFWGSEIMFGPIDSPVAAGKW